MARSSPGVLRVAAILNFIAEHPGQSFTLTDLVKALKLSRATCHALLTGLVEVGYLYRASDKNYVLGPALAAIGRAAAQHASPLQIAQPEIRALANEFEVVCGIFTRDRNELVARDRASSLSYVGWATPIGTRLKLRPGAAAIHLVATPRDEVEAWLATYEPKPTPEQIQSMWDGMAFVRAHGFLPLLSTLDMPYQTEAQRAAAAQTAENITSALTDLRNDQRYPVTGIVAPVFDARGQVAFTIDLSHFTGPITGAEIKHMGGRLREACERISTFITGRSPVASASGKADDESQRCGEVI
jgi:DNA-binding IclR family transcriptional regulator